MAKRDSKDEIRQKIKNVIQQMNQDDEFIDSAENLKKNLADKHQIVSDSNLIR